MDEGIFIFTKVCDKFDLETRSTPDGKFITSTTIPMAREVVESSSLQEAINVHSRFIQLGVIQSKIEE
jgi:hypothetical protein